jgi:glycosyltransferase involved in cell wall biosynthesis
MSTEVPAISTITPATASADLAALAAEAGLQRIHVLAWRDLDDVEAGGSELHASRVAARWAEAGLDVTMRTSHAHGHPENSYRDGYRVIRRSGRYAVFPNAVISELLHQHGPRDAVVEIWNGVPFLTPLWFRGPRSVILHHVHRDMWDMVIEGRLATYGRVFESRIAPRFYRHTPVVTLSTSSRDELVSLLGLPAGNISVVPVGIDERFSPIGARKSERPLVLAVGRLMPPKRFDEVIRQCAEVRRDVPDLELVIAGEGYEKANLVALIESLDARDWVHLAGYVPDDDLVELYQRAWVVTSASTAEGWGMTMTEAAACGTPAVATDIAGHRDSVADDESGLLGATASAMVDKLRAVLTDHELRLRLSEGALKHANAFTWDACAYNNLVPLARESMRRRGRDEVIILP